MISSRKEYLNYLKADRIALGVIDWSIKQRILYYLVPGLTLKFHRILRKCEYYKNCKKGYINKLIYWYYFYQFRRISVRLGFSVPENIFGPGLAIVHYGTVVVHKNAKVGKNCRIQACTNIGASGGSDRAPVIGDNVYIGPGAKIYGDIKIASNTAIAANACVNRSVLSEGYLVGGVPAELIKEIDITRIITCAR